MNDIVNSRFSASEKEQHQMLLSCMKILTMVVADPVFRVYLGCIVSFGVHYFLRGNNNSCHE